EASRDVDRRVARAAQLGCGQPRQLACVLSALGVMRQSGHENVVALRVERLGERRELARRIGESVEQYDYAWRAAPVGEQDGRAARRRDDLVGRDLSPGPRDGVGVVTRRSGM